jgi:hypothetical protein
VSDAAGVGGVSCGCYHRFMARLRHLFVCLTLLAAAWPGSLSARTQEKPDKKEKVEYVSVDGLVARPGQIVWSKGMTVANAIEKSGGMTDPQKAPEDMYLTSKLLRGEGSKKKQIKPKRDTVLDAGDVLIVGRDLW